jgi:uncharacterized coiled-coil DUF342 family protein
MTAPASKAKGQTKTETPKAPDDAAKGAKETAAAPPVPDAATTPTTEVPSGPVDVRNMQDKFNNLLTARNQFNDLARAAREERDLLNEGRRTKSLEMEEAKTARDAANEVMRTHKELRNAYQDQAKALIDAKKGKSGAMERSLPLQVRKMRNDLQALVEQQQTTQLTVAKERVLVEKIRDLWTELKVKEEELKKQKTVKADLAGADATIDELFAKADEEHAHVAAAMKEAAAHHEKFIAGIKEVRVLVAEANKKHAEFVAYKEKADESHNKAMEMREKVMAVREAKKAEYDAARKEIRDVNQSARRNVADPKAIDQYKEKALEELKKGGKITLGF